MSRIRERSVDGGVEHGGVKICVFRYLSGNATSTPITQANKKSKVHKQGHRTTGHSAKT